MPNFMLNDILHADEIQAELVESSPDDIRWLYEKYVVQIVDGEVVEAEHLEKAMTLLGIDHDELGADLEATRNAAATARLHEIIHGNSSDNSPEQKLARTFEQARKSLA